MLHCKLRSIGDVNSFGHRDVHFEVNGQSRVVYVQDRRSKEAASRRERANGDDIGNIGSPMNGEILAVRVREGQEVSPGETVAILSAMKFEVAITATKSGMVKRVLVSPRDFVKKGDLLIEIA